VAQGDTITPFYDPMVAKVIAHGPTREEARQRLAAMLDGTAVWPVRTNAAFLVRALAHPQFVAGTVDTGVIGRDGAAMAEALPPSPAALARAAARLIAPSLAPGLRLNAAPARTGHFLLDGAPIAIALDGSHATHTPQRATLVCEGGQAWRLEPWHHQASDAASAGDGAILAPMPGRVIAVDVAQGQAVTKGQKLLTLEAMKMEHTLLAPFDGVVEALETEAGAQVQVDALLARIAHQEA
jgi:3-methylcrotonyl-CoA carboxylase alpha subunit